MNLVLKTLNKINKNEKNKDIIINLLITVVLKGGAYFISFFSMPLSIKYFDNQIILGVWFTILSMLTWIFTFDLGLGNGLRNILVDDFVKKDYKKAKQNISSSYFCMTVLGIVFFLLGIIIFRFINWNSIFNVDTKFINNDTFILCMNILLLGILINFILRIFNSILYAMQKSFINNLLAFFSSTLQVLYLWLGKSNSLENNLINLCFVYIITTCLPILICSVIVFNKKLKKCKPSIKYISKNSVFSILKLGSNFFIIQILFMLIISTNEIIISNFFSPESVVEYQVYYKLFITVGSLISIALTPFWSAVTKAISQNDFKWIKKINRILFLFGGIAILLELLLVPLVQTIVNVWLNKNTIHINNVYAFIFAIFGSVYLFNIIVTTIANGTSRLKVQKYFYLLGFIIKIPLVVLLKYFCDEWIVVIIANNIILIPFCIIQAISTNKYINKNFNHKEAQSNEHI